MYVEPRKPRKQKVDANGQLMFDMVTGNPIFERKKPERKGSRYVRQGNARPPTAPCTL